MAYRSCLAVLALLAALWVAPGAAEAQQPSSVNPTALSVQEQQLLQALNPGNPTLAGRISIPDPKAANLIQPAGRDWRAVHQQTLPWIAAIAILGMTVLLSLFFAIRGRIRVEGGFSGRTITRFAWLDRFAHWLAASTFLVLALTGLNITVGRFVLLPVIGPEAFTAMSQFGKYLHNYLAWPFMLGLVLMFLLWVKDNLPSARDIDWLAKGGGLFKSGVHVMADRFNAGQKGIFWSVILGGAALSVSGFFMLFPYESGGVTAMQLWTTVHALAGIVLVAIMVAHIYIGSIGMEGAFDAMGSGEVDVNWAREHHAVWTEKELAKGPARPAPGSAPAPAE